MRPISLALLPLLLALLPWLPWLPSSAEAQVRVVNPRLTTDSSIDCSSVDSVLAQILKPGMTDEAKARACWEFMLDHYYHWWPPQEADGGGDVRDFAKAINSYGFGPCFVAAPVETALWDAAGFKTRCWTITGHTIPEVFYGGAWHMLDCDGRGWHRKADGQIASVEELAHDLKLFTEPKERSDPYYPEGLPYESHKQYEFWGPASKISDLYASTNDNYRFNERAVFGHPMFVDLRPGETLFLNYGNVGKFVKWKGYPEKEKPNGPQEEVRRKTPYGNGTLVWEPDFNTISADDLLWSGSENVKLADGKLVAVDPAKGAVAVFRVFCPWVLVEANFRVNSIGPDANPKVDVSADGGRSWAKPFPASISGGQQWEAEYFLLMLTFGNPTSAPDPAKAQPGAGRYEYLVRVTLGQGPIIGVRFNNTFQLAPLSLPRLKAGKNTVTVFRGPDRGVVQLVQAGKATTRPDILVESKGLNLAKGITPAKPDEPGVAIYKLVAPAALKAISVGGQVTLDYGQRPTLDADYSLDSGSTWKPAFAIHGNSNGQNAQFERNARFELPDNSGKELLVRFTLAGDNSFGRGKQYCGVNSIRLYGYYDLPQPAGAKLKVDIAWAEAPDGVAAAADAKPAERSHSLVVDKFPTSFDLTCGGQEGQPVRLKSITMTPVK